MIGIDDLRTLDKANKQAIIQLLLNNPTVHYWSAGEYERLSLNFSIIKHFSSGRECKGIPGPRVRYEVMDNEVFGSGNFGTFYRCRFTLSIDDDGELQVKERKPDRVRLVKVQESIYQEKSMLDQIILEAHVLSQSDVFHSKPLVIDQGKTYIIMKELPGVQLYTLMIENQLTIKQRYVLTLELIRALKEQIHDKGWIHRDIKPENIMVYQNGDTFQIYIIDFGFISNIDDKPTNRVGTIPYAAPECYRDWKVKNTKTDIYALGLILLYLWNDIPVKPECYDLLIEHFEKMVHPKMVFRPVLSDLLSNIMELEQILQPVNVHVYHEVAPAPLRTCLSI